MADIFTRTTVNPEEYKTLTPVPPELWGRKIKDGWNMNSLGSCDVNMGHGRAHHYHQTPDHRAIATCFGCFAEIEKAQAS